jgi:cell fate regulator YaaT (PSP1 superfamily)
MKSCYVNVDRLIGIVELEAPDDASWGTVLSANSTREHASVRCLQTRRNHKEGLKKITRKHQKDLTEYALKEKEKHAFDFCKQKISEMNLPMKLLSTEYLFGNTKLLFYFISESRVDFRELVKELAKEFKIRVELRQVGVRDEAKIIGGLGNCGNTVCCRRFLHNFSIVSIKMVKEQHLALNPAKISGICGRLMCCLSYEYDTYVSCKKGFPKIGKKVVTPQGEGKVIKHNTLSSTITVHLDDGKDVTLPVKDIRLLTEQDNKPAGTPQQQPKKSDKQQAGKLSPD